LNAQVTNAINGTPGVAELPGVGYLAGSQSDQDTDQELLILVTPRLVRQSPRKDHVIYAGEGSLDQGGAVGTTGGPIRVGPPEATSPAEASPQRQPVVAPPQAPPDAPPSNPEGPAPAQPPQTPPADAQPGTPVAPQQPPAGVQPTPQNQQ